MCPSSTLITQKGFEIYTDGSKRQLLEPSLLRITGQLLFSAENSLSVSKNTVVQRNAVGPIHCSLHRPQKSHARCAGLTCDRVHRWHLLLEEYGPKIVYVKGILYTVADAISCLDFGPIEDIKENWMTFTKYWCYYTMQAEEETSPVKHADLMNFVFANRSEENAI
eukprot:CCRYP_011005-RA/>CCRYP_011005-RA protein AED:0.35 eAED:0.65 QI:0/0/0/1/0/0/2/0/165